MKKGALEMLLLLFSRSEVNRLSVCFSIGGQDKQIMFQCQGAR